MVFFTYWTGVWAVSGVGIYCVLAATGLDVVPAVEAVDEALGSDLASRFNPSLGRVAVAVAVNELCEFVRFPVVLATTPMVVRQWEAWRGKKA